MSNVHRNRPQKMLNGPGTVGDSGLVLTAEAELWQAQACGSQELDEHGAWDRLTSYIILADFRQAASSKVKIHGG